MKSYSIETRQFSERNLTRMGMIVSVQLNDGGTDPGPASKMTYTVAINDAGTHPGIIPAKIRWSDEWDVDAIRPNTPVTCHYVRGRWFIVDREERAAEECP